MATLPLGDVRPSGDLRGRTVRCRDLSPFPLALGLADFFLLLYGGEDGFFAGVRDLAFSPHLLRLPCPGSLAWSATFADDAFPRLLLVCEPEGTMGALSETEGAGVRAPRRKRLPLLMEERLKRARRLLDIEEPGSEGPALSRQEPVLDTHRSATLLLAQPRADAQDSLPNSKACRSLLLSGLRLRNSCRTWG